MSLILGIDPGANTGVASYIGGKLVHLCTISPVEIADKLESVRPSRVILEDSRLQSYVWTTSTSKAAAAKMARNLGEIDVKSAHRKTIAFGFDSLMNGGTSRTSARTAAFLIRPPVLAARMGGRKPCRLASAVPGLSTRPSRRPHLTVSAPVFRPELGGSKMSLSIKDSVSISRVRALLEYNEIDGGLVWKVRVSNIQKGQIAGTKNGTKYRQIRIDGKVVMEHRLVWFHVNGEWPKGEIDHINGETCDNRIENLRDVSGGVNMQNLRSPRSTNKVGLLGVTQVGKRFRATIRLNYVAKYLGMYDTPEQAHDAYLNAKRLLHVGCTI